MTARTVDLLLDERARLVTQQAATSGHLWAAEFLLKRVDKILQHAILPTPALAAHRDVLRDEIHELLAEDREHPAADVVADDTWPPDSALPGDDGADPMPASGDVAGQRGTAEPY